MYLELRNQPPINLSNQRRGSNYNYNIRPSRVAKNTTLKIMPIIIMFIDF